MTTSKTFHLKQALTLFALAFMLLSSAACSKKDSKKANVSRYTRSDGWRSPYYNQDGSQSSGWGAITRNGDFNSVLRSFLPDASDLGYVSGRANDDTGIRFRGEAVRGGSFEILIWDEIADRTGQAYWWQLEVVDVNGDEVVLQDDQGEVVFSGRMSSGGMWSGTVYFDGNKTLGNFSIGLQEVGLY